MTPANKGALERIAAALEHIADNMDAAKVLEERRRKKAARQARYRASRIAVASTVDATERNEEAKEGKSPHTPLKGEREEAKKELPSSRAHARGFVPPTADEVAAYCRERHSPVDPVAFWNFYASKDWMIGKNRMKNWRCAVVTWERDPSRQPFSGSAPLDPKAAAFERQRAEAEERKRRAAEIVRWLDSKGGAE